MGAAVLAVDAAAHRLLPALLRYEVRPGDEALPPTAQPLVDNTFGFDQRVPYASPIDGLYSCSAGCHPAGSVIGASGHNAANRILRDMQL